MALYDRQDSETDKAWQAFQDFRDMGTGRSPTELAKQYKEKKGKKKNVPTTSYDTLKNWAWENKWTERAKAWDANKAEKEIAYKKQLEHEAWEREVEAYRDRTRRAAASLTEIAIMSMGIIKKTLASNELTVDQAIRLYGATPKSLEVGSSLEGTALNILPLLEEMEKNREQ